MPLQQLLCTKSSQREIEDTAGRSKKEPSLNYPLETKKETVLWMLACYCELAGCSHVLGKPLEGLEKAVCNQHWLLACVYYSWQTFRDKRHKWKTGYAHITMMMVLHAKWDVYMASYRNSDTWQASYMTASRVVNTVTDNRQTPVIPEYKLCFINLTTQPDCYEVSALRCSNLICFRQVRLGWDHWPSFEEKEAGATARV